MVDGRVRNLTAHYERLDITDPTAINAQLRSAGPGAFFPLIDASGTVTLRPDRPFSPLITVDPRPHLDARTNPTVKGPDLAWLAERQAASQRRGFDEGILMDSSGVLVEGVFSALIVWRDGEPVASAHPRALNSTTLAAVRQLMDIDLDLLTPEDLCQPLWLLNAFSGVRTTDESYPVEKINARLWELAEPV